MSHAPQPSATGKRRVVSAGGRPSVRVEERIAANENVIAVTLDASTAFDALTLELDRDLRQCRCLERDLRETCIHCREAREKLDALRTRSRRENEELCRGEALVSEALA